MPGAPSTSQFHFSTATLLVAPMASQLAFNPLTHSLGLVKNVMVEASPTVVNLTQGIQNDIAASAINDFPIKVSAEVYEFTARNFAYGLSLDATGAGFAPIAASYIPTAAVSAGATTVTLPGNVTTEFVAGSWMFIQEGLDDYIHIARVVSSAFSTNTTVTFTGMPVPTGMNFTTAAGRVGLMRRTDADPNNANNTFACRIIGTQFQDKRPVILHFPKVRITKGFSMRFATDNFQNLPFEFTPQTPLVADPGYSANFINRMSILSP